MTAVGSAAPRFGSTAVGSAAPGPPVCGRTLVAPFGSYEPAPCGRTCVGSAAPDVSGTGAGAGSGIRSAPTPSAAAICVEFACTPMPSATTRRPRARFTALGRSSGFLRRQRSMTVHSGSGTVEGRRGSALRCWCSTSRAELPANGGRPVTSSYSRMPAP